MGMKRSPSDSKDSIQHLAAGSALGRQDLDDPPLLHEGGPVRAAQRHLVILLGQQHRNTGRLQRANQVR